MPIVSDVSELSAFIFMLTEKNDLTLWLQGETYYQISFLCARVSSYLSKDRNREGIGNLDILRCLDTYVGNGKTVGIPIEGCSKWHCTDACLPITATQLEWSGSLEIR